MVAMEDIPPGKDCEAHYRRLKSECDSILTQSFSGEGLKNIGKCHNFIADYGKWISVLSLRMEAEVFETAVSEYQFSLMSLVLGHYRQSYNSLRLFIELTLNGIFLSANELELRLWLKGSRDIFWEAVSNYDTGLFSSKFAKAFFEGLSGEVTPLGALAKQVYRECSEFVHGNPNGRIKVPKTLSFNNELFEDWLEKADSARYLVNFSFFLRYGMEMTSEKKRLLESFLPEELGHIAVVRDYFDKIAKVGE